MKKRTRAITGMMLAATCALGTVMSGCGGGGGGGADDDVVKIAVPIPLTGESAKAGGELQDAITMAFEEIDYTIGDDKGNHTVHRHVDAGDPYGTLPDSLNSEKFRTEDHLCDILNNETDTRRYKKCIQTPVRLGSFSQRIKGQPLDHSAKQEADHSRHDNGYKTGKSQQAERYIGAVCADQIKFSVSEVWYSHNTINQRQTHTNQNIHAAF